MRRVVVKVEPCFGISSPGVLNLKQQVTKESEVGGVARLKFLLRKPCLAEPRYLTIPGQLERIAGNAVDPGVADLLLHRRQVGLKRFDRIGDLSEVGGDDLSVGKLMFQVSTGFYNLIWFVGSAVVICHHDG